MELINVRMIIRFIKRYIWPTSGRALIAIAVLWVFQSLLVSYQGMLFQRMIDSITSGKSSSLLSYAVLLLAMAITVIAVGYISNLLLWKRAYYTVAELRSVMMDKLVLSGTRNGIQPGSIISRLFSDLEFAVYNTMSIIPSIILHLSRITANVLVMLSLSAVLTVVALLFLPLNVIAYVWYRSKVPSARSHERKLYGDMTEGMRSTIESMQVIHEFHVEDHYRFYFRDIVGRWREAVIRILRYERSYWALNNFVASVGPIVLLISGSYMAYRGMTTIGTVIAIVMLSSPLYWAMIWFLWQFSMSSQLPPVLLRLEDVLLASATLRRCDSASEVSEIELKDVSYVLHEKVILDSISMKMKRRERIAIIGGTESGKSTLARIIAGVISPSSGTILINGLAVNEVREALRGKVLLISEGDSIIPGSLSDNVTLKRDVPEEEVLQVLRVVDFDPNKYAEGLDTIIDVDKQYLPEPDKRKIILARALLSRPEVLILDGVLSSFDAKTEAKILDKISGYLRDSLIIAIEVRPLSLSRVDTILVLHLGKIIVKGSVHELVLNERFRGLFEKLFGISPQACPNLMAKST